MRSALVTLLLLLTGCAAGDRTSTAPHPAEGPSDARPVPPPLSAPLPGDVLTATAPERPDPARAPRDYLVWAGGEYAELEQYTVTFVREEIRGLGIFKSMRPAEEIHCRYRREPFSIRMTWLDPEIKYGESSFVRGWFDDRVRFIPRHGLFGLPPTLTRVALQTPVTWGEARYPVSDFGLERVIEKTLDVVRRAGPEARVSYVGREPVAWVDGDAHVIQIDVPVAHSDTPRSQLLFASETDLLAGTRLFDASGQRVASYRYRDLDPQVRLTDADFLLDGEDPDSDVVASSDEAAP